MVFDAGGSNIAHGDGDKSVLVVLVVNQSTRIAWEVPLKNNWILRQKCSVPCTEIGQLSTLVFDQGFRVC